MTIFYILIVIVVVIALIRFQNAPDRPQGRRKPSNINAPHTSKNRKKKSGTGSTGNESWWFAEESGDSHEGGDSFDGGSSDGGGSSSSDF